MSAPGNLYSCPTCGASLSLEQLRGTNCPFCHTVFPHHGRAVEHAALVNQVMAQHLQQQGYPPGPPVIQNPSYGAPPPQYGYNPYGQVQASVDQSLKRAASITVFVFVGVGVMMLVIGGIIAAMMILY